jgi:hypothetical protein
VRAAILAVAALSTLALAACKSSSGGASSTGAGGCMLVGFGGGCAIESDDCTNCVQSVCDAESLACSADPVCAVASCALQNCLCPRQVRDQEVTFPACEETFRNAGSAAAAAAACLEARCATLCGW